MSAGASGHRGLIHPLSWSFRDVIIFQRKEPMIGSVPTVTVAHRVRRIAYHIIRDGGSYRELGGDWNASV